MAKKKIKLGAPRKYTPEQLQKAVEKWFNSITRVQEITEMVPVKDADGVILKDDHGHDIYHQIPVINSLGETAVKTEYLTPPTVGNLCTFLGIHRDTWASYCNDPDYSDTTTPARGRMLEWREEQLLTRDKTRGVEFDLQNNWGYSTKAEVQVGSVEDYLAKLQEEGQGQEF